MSAAAPSRSPAAPRSVARRTATATALVGVALVLALLMGLAATRPADPVATDPEDATPSGGRAVAQVLARQGIPVTVARSVDQVRDAAPGADVTVLLSRPDRLDRDNAAALADVTRSAGRLVVVLPDDSTLGALRIPADIADRTDGDLRGGCWDGASTGPDVEADWRVSGPATLYQPRPRAGEGSPVTGKDPATTAKGHPSAGKGSASTVHGSAATGPGPLSGMADPVRVVATHPGTAGCLSPLDHRAPEPQSEPQGFAYLRLAATTARPEVVLFGTSSPLRNSTVTELDNAAVAMRTLGRHSRVVWLLPEIPTADAGGPMILPEWFEPALFALAGVFVGLCLWRGRRLGRLAVEPLPVVVPAGETVLARARLYQRAGEPDRALAVLQVAATARLAQHLGLPRTAPVGPVAEAAATRAGRSAEEVRALLTPRNTRRNGQNDMVREAQELRRLESEVRGP